MLSVTSAQAQAYTHIKSGETRSFPQHHLPSFAINSQHDEVFPHSSYDFLCIEPRFASSQGTRHPCIGGGLPFCCRLDVLTVDIQTRANATCPDPTQTVPFYRVYDASATNHWYGTDVSGVTTRIASDNFVLESVAAQVYETQVVSTVPLYWIHDGSTAATDNYYTTDTTEVTAGQINEGIVAYIFPSEICGSVPFYRLKSSVDNFHTTSASERDSAVASGYTYVGITGYVGYQNLCEFLLRLCLISKLTLGRNHHHLI